MSDEPVTAIGILNELIQELFSGQDADIENVSDRIGALTDFVNVPYTQGANSIIAFLETSYLHIHGRSFVYPNHANNTVLTSGSGAWGLGGSKIEVIPANALNVSNFDLHWINISNISGNAELQVDIYSGGAGSEVLIGSTRPFRNGVLSQEGPRRIQVPQQLKNSRISCLLSDSTAGTITCAVSFEGHYYTI